MAGPRQGGGAAALADRTNAGAPAAGAAARGAELPEFLKGAPGAGAKYVRKQRTRGEGEPAALATTANKPSDGNRKSRGGAGGMLGFLGRSLSGRRSSYGPGGPYRPGVEDAEAQTGTGSPPEKRKPGGAAGGKKPGRKKKAAPGPGYPRKAVRGRRGPRRAPPRLTALSPIASPWAEGRGLLQAPPATSVCEGTVWFGDLGGDVHGGSRGAGGGNRRCNRGSRSRPAVIGLWPA